MMDNFEKIGSDDTEERYETYKILLQLTNGKVDWAYQVWDELLEYLTDTNNHRRTIAAQLLCNLAKSDSEERILTDFSAIWSVTKDIKFVTARHTLQSIWKIALVGDKQKSLVLKHFDERFRNCEKEKNHTLIRYDIIQAMHQIYQEQADENVKQLAFVLIAIEQDVKYQKKYEKVWK